MTMPDRILIIDDEDALLRTISNYLESIGYDVDSAHELEEAEALLANFHYALVITDLRLTDVCGTEGLEIVAYVRQRCPWSRVIVLTANATPQIMNEALRLGAAAFLEKPKPLHEVGNVVSGLLQAC
jgi:DNA-binding NtrC family response regulator